MYTFHDSLYRFISVLLLRWIAIVIITKLYYIIIIIIIISNSSISIIIIFLLLLYSQGSWIIYYVALYTFCYISSKHNYKSRSKFTINHSFISLQLRLCRCEEITIVRLPRTLFTALGSGSMNFLPPLFTDQFDLEQFFVDVSITITLISSTDQSKWSTTLDSFFKP